MATIIPTIHELDDHLKDLVHWELFAIYLPGIDTVDIELIKMDHIYHIESQKIALFSAWLSRYPRASWKDVVFALEKIQEYTIATKIRDRFYGGKAIHSHTHQIH